jgi:hypothetical protein
MNQVALITGGGNASLQSPLHLKRSEACLVRWCDNV